ncbi:MAG: hypothetical protein HC893_15445 [Chloroflexaceae bacterium]|nr:hypothetical protein [Chloroflexaceae bacterium]
MVVLAGSIFTVLTLINAAATPRPLPDHLQLPPFPGAQLVAVDDQMGRELAFAVIEEVELRRGGDVTAGAEVYRVPNNVSFDDIKAYYQSVLEAQDLELILEAGPDATFTPTLKLIAESGPYATSSFTPTIDWQEIEWRNYRGGYVHLYLYSGPDIENAIPGQHYLILHVLSTGSGMQPCPQGEPA